jgi:hypothetical protein
MKMLRIRYSVLVLSIIFGSMIELTSCSKDDILDTDSGNAPSSIVGKRLLFNGGSYNVYGFTSNGGCNVPEGIEYGITTNLTKYPTYTYKKNSSSTASFTCNYSEKSKILSEYTYYDVSYNLTLSFITTTSGNLTGTVNFIKTGGNGGKSMYFTFKDKAFTFQ